MSDSVLSSQEYAVMVHVASGLPNKRIAEQMFLSPYTVKTHIRNVRAKLTADLPQGRVTRWQIVNACRRRGWLS